MAELEWSKERCEKEDGTTHYDSFKKQKDIDKLATTASNFKKKNFTHRWYSDGNANIFFNKISPTVDTVTQERGYSDGTTWV